MRGKRIGASTLRKVMVAADVDASPHRFRASFKDWTRLTGVTRELAKACLAHAVGNATEHAYERDDLL